MNGLCLRCACTMAFVRDVWFLGLCKHVSGRLGDGNEIPRQFRPLGTIISLNGGGLLGLEMHRFVKNCVKAKILMLQVHDKANIF